MQQLQCYSWYTAAATNFAINCSIVTISGLVTTYKFLQQIKVTK